MESEPGAPLPRGRGRWWLARKRAANPRLRLTAREAECASRIGPSALATTLAALPAPCGAKPTSALQAATTTAIAGRCADRGRRRGPDARRARRATGAGARAR
eukprot:972350-Pyramimonas_sp.AAC.1